MSGSRWQEFAASRVAHVAGRRPVVILNMHYTGLGIARDLAGSGVEVFGLSSAAGFAGSFTRYCEHRRFPDTALEAEACREFLVRFGRDFALAPVLLPTRDHDINFILRYREDLERHFVVPYPTSETMAEILDKDRIADVAAEVGIACPRSWTIGSSEELNARRPEMAFPVIMKPIRSTQWRNRRIWPIVGQKVILFEDFASMLDTYSRIEPFDGRVQVQEFIPGPDTHLSIFGSYRNGARGALRYFTARKVLQHPPRSGTGVAVRSCRIPEIVEPSRRLLARLGYSGMSELEYKFDARSDRFVLIEMNPRHWDQHTLGTASGVNLTRAMIDDLAGRGLADGGQEREGATWVADDEFLYSMVSNLRSREYPMRLYREAFAGGLRFAVADRRDPVPALHLAATTLRTWLARFARRVLVRRRRSPRIGP